MRFKEVYLLLFAVMPITSHSATVVNFGATLCGTGQHMVSGACVSKERATCPSGYYKTFIGDITFAAPSLELKSCMNSYNSTEIPDVLHPIYNGVLVSFGATLCDAGQHMSSGECVSMERATCPSGYYKTLIGDNTFSSPSLELKSCMNSYNSYSLPDVLHPIYNGVLVSFGATLCGADEQFGSGACQPREQGRCSDGYYKTLIGANTFSSPSAELNECMNSYNQYELPEFLSAIYNGVLVNFGAHLCGNGQYLSDGACISRVQGECPDNFLDISVSETTMLPRENAQCASGYKSFVLTANCASGDTQNGLCATLCDAGLTYSGTGACGTMCSVNPDRTVTLKSLSGIALPLYSTRLTTPSVNVATSDGGVCYGNLVPGTMRGAINMTVSGKNYYLTD